VIRVAVALSLLLVACGGRVAPLDAEPEPVVDVCSAKTRDAWCAVVAAGGDSASVDEASACCDRWIDEALVAEAP
jgi:hypothetical protein